MKLSTEMTPRAWRMISYCTVGFLIYGLFLLHQLLLNLHLNRIDQQLKDIDQAAMVEVETGSPAAKPAPTADKGS